MGNTAIARKKVDPIAIATKGQVTSQIQTQESSEKPVIISAKNEV